MQVHELTPVRRSAAPQPAAILETISKAAAVLSVLLIVLLELGLNRDITWTLRALTAVAIAVGWTLPAIAPRWTAALWLFVAPVAPAIVGRLAHREGPVVDLVWIAGLAVSLIRVTNWSRWELPGGWRVLVGGWALALALGWPVIAARELAFDPRLLSDTGAVNSFAMLSAPQVFAWVLYVALTQLAGALWLDVVLGRIVRDRAELGRVATALATGVSAASAVAIYQGLGHFAFLSTANWASLHRAAGTMMDANAYGVIAAMTGPIALVGLRLGAHKRATTAGVTVLAITLAGMWMSGSRTALLCAIGGVAGVAVSATLLQRERASRMLQAVAAAAVVVLIVAVIASSSVGPLRRLREALPQGTRGAIASLWTRGGYGTVAVQMVREYPLTGVGVGTYHVIAPDYWHRITNDDGLPFDNAQNWWRHQAAELGLLGGASLLLWSLLAGWVLLFGRVQAGQRFASFTLRGVMLGVAACSMVGMPTQSPLVLLAFLLIVGWLASTLASADLPLVPRDSTAAWTVVAVLAVAYAGAHVWLGHRSLSVMSRAIRADREYVVGAYPAEALPGGNEFRWTRQAATFVWPAHPGVLVLRVWAGNPDLARRPVSVTVSTACGTLFDGSVTTTEPVDLPFRVSDGEPVVAAVRVSRTWRPSDVDRTSADHRALGVAVVKDWLSAGEATEAPVRPLPSCQRGS